MRVVVKVHRSAEPDYRAWRQRNSRPPSGSPEMAQLLEDELCGHLERAQGRPEGAKVNADADPPYWVWRFSSDTWVRYILKDRTEWPLGGRVRKVVILAIRNAPLA